MIWAEWPNRRLYREIVFIVFSPSAALKCSKSGGFGGTNTKLESGERRSKFH